MNDYERIARIIRYVDAARPDQPDLAAMAREAGLSPHHFHRLFTEWAAITPKDFLQCLTLTHAKNLLREGLSVLDAALDSGLSGPGRLHDLCVTLDAASPGEWKSGGAGWTLIAGLTSTPFGDCLLAECPRGICHLTFPDEADPEAGFAELRREWPAAVIVRSDAAAKARAAGIFVRPGEGAGRTAPLRALVRGTPFQVRVWRALIRLPFGTLTTYSRLAEATGNTAAARATGSAVGRNALAWIIPCHRVIRETGVVSDYRWGPERKKAMLVWESAGRQAGGAVP